MLSNGYVTAQEVDSARTAVHDAEVSLEQARASASDSNTFVGTLDTRQAGVDVVTGAPRFTLIDTAHWRVSALFRETDLPHIHVGARARVFLLSAPDQPINGRVASIGWGIHTQAQAQVLGLPVVANKLDWVRSAQRFPVEIELQDPPRELTRLGASASVRILGSGE